MNLTIRNATIEDLDQLVTIEATCFPQAEAASRAAIEERLSVYSKGFFVAVSDGKIVGFVNGASFDTPVIKDEYFETMDLHKDDGVNLMVFGLDVLPAYQRKGIARKLMDHFISFSKSDGKQGLLLTCKDHLVAYYSSFGYKNLGVSESTHGGAKWYDMRLELS